MHTRLDRGLPGRNTDRCNTRLDILAGHGRDRHSSHFVDSDHLAGRRSTLCMPISRVWVNGESDDARLIVIGVAVTLLVVVASTLVVVVLAVLVVVIVGVLALMAIAIVIVTALLLLCRHRGVG